MALKNYGKKAFAASKESSRGFSAGYFAASLLSMGTALAFKQLKRRHPAFLVAEWVVPFLIMGVYDKMRKSRK